MINTMEYIALLSGVLISSACLYYKKNYNWVIMYFVFYKYRNTEKFYSLFDQIKKEIIVEYIEISNMPHKPSDYTKIIKELRPDAHKQAMAYYGNIASIVIFRIMPICLLPAIIFLSNWYAYLAGVLMIILFMISYLIIIKPESVKMYRETVIGAVINEFIRDKRKKGI